MNDQEIQALRVKWLQYCGNCDSGLPVGCACPAEDPRHVVKLLLDEIDDLQQVARQSYGDLQREYMALEVKYHDLKKQYDIELARSASYQGALLMVADKKPMPPWGVDEYMNSIKEES